MIGLPHFLTAASLFILLLGLIFFVYHIFVRKNVLLKLTGYRLFFSCTIFVFFISLCCFAGYIYSKPYLDLNTSLIVFFQTLLFIFVFGWFYCMLKGTQETTMEILETLIGVLETRAKNLGGHSLHVRNLAMLLYDYLPINYRSAIDRESLQFATLLLDIGKLGIPSEIISKNGKLEESEWELIRLHPDFGMNILLQIPSFDTIALWVKYHHERVDGSGYYHLKENEIPLASRLIAVVDTYSAITIERSYKAVLPYENAITELRLSAGSQLDRELVDVFCSIPMNKVERCLHDAKEKMHRYEELF